MNRTRKAKELVAGSALDAALAPAAPVAQPDDEFETRADGKRARVDRWEVAIRRIVALLWGNRHEFEVDEVVEAVRALVPSPNEDDEALVQAVLACNYSGTPNGSAPADPVAPAGWVLVPVEPTPAMRQAGVGWGTASSTWEHMLAAAPAAPVAQREMIGFMNAGHLHELKEGRLPYGYVYPKEESGAHVPVYTAHGIGQGGAA